MDSVDLFFKKEYYKSEKKSVPIKMKHVFDDFLHSDSYYGLEKKKRREINYHKFMSQLQSNGISISKENKQYFIKGYTLYKSERDIILKI